MGGGATERARCIVPLQGDESEEWRSKVVAIGERGPGFVLGPSRSTLLGKFQPR